MKSSLKKPGVDLNNPAQRGLVEKIFWRRWAPQVRAAGLDPDDCLQQVYLGILARNQGKRPWDPSISSLSNYSYIVIRSVVRNQVDSHKRARRRGWTCGAEEDASLWDAPGMHSWQAPTPGASDLPRVLLQRVAEGEDPITAALQVIPDGPLALIIGWELMREQEVRKKPSRKTRRKPKPKARSARPSWASSKRKRVSTPQVRGTLTLWDLEAFQAARVRAA